MKPAKIRGGEKQPSFFHHRKETKPYHIDYVFMSRHLLSYSSIELGDMSNWLTLSDHMPLIVTMDLDQNESCL